MKASRARRGSLRAFAVPIVGLGAVVLAALYRSETPDRPEDDGKPAVPPGRPAVVGRFESASIAECSGLVASRKNPGVFWAHNDSGDGPRLFAIRGDGTITHELEVTGAEATDWEDIAIGPGPGGDEPHIYVSDTGNNSRSRERLTIYRFPEPRLEASGRKLRTKKAARIEFQYERGRHDCEALVVHPRSGDLYLITKFPLLAQVFHIPVPELPAGGRSELLTAKLVGTLRVQDLVTGADLSRDGRRLVVRTYLSILEYEVDPERSFGGETRPRELRVIPHRESQSEAICFTPEGHILTTSEGKEQPIYLLKRE